MPRDAVSRTANVGTVGMNGLIEQQMAVANWCRNRLGPSAFFCNDLDQVVVVVMTTR